MAKFSAYNQPIKCRGCGARTTATANGVTGRDRCATCQKADEMEMAHADGAHKHESADGCKACEDADGSNPVDLSAWQRPVMG